MERKREGMRWEREIANDLKREIRKWRRMSERERRESGKERG